MSYKSKKDEFYPNEFDYVKLMTLFTVPLIVTSPLHIRNGREFGEEMFKALSEQFVRTQPPLRDKNGFLHMLFNCIPGIILIENNFDGIDMIECIKALKTGDVCKNTEFYIVAKRTNKTLEAKCEESPYIKGVIYASAPIKESVERIAKNYREMLNERVRLNKTLDNLPDQRSPYLTFMDSGGEGKLFSGDLINDLLRPLGFDRKQIGTQYACTMIALGLLGCASSMNEMYEYIALIECTTPQIVEKSIRYSIEQAWTRPTSAMQMIIFGNTIDPEKGKPTNAEFLSAIVQHIRTHNYRNMLVCGEIDD